MAENKTMTPEEQLHLESLHISLVNLASTVCGKPSSELLGLSNEELENIIKTGRL